MRKGVRNPAAHSVEVWREDTGGKGRGIKGRVEEEERRYYGIKYPWL